MAKVKGYLAPAAKAEDVMIAPDVQDTGLRNARL
jgi:hypothetical protein